MMSSGLLIVCPSCAKRKTESLSLLRAKRAHTGLNYIAAAIDVHSNFVSETQFRKICVLHQIQCALISNSETMKA